jgi:hypothetical protein
MKERDKASCFGLRMGDISRFRLMARFYWLTWSICPLWRDRGHPWKYHANKEGGHVQRSGLSR